MRNPGKLLLAEFGIQSFGIKNSTLGMQNLANDCNLESKFQLTKNIESRTWNLRSTVWNPESKNILDYTLDGANSREKNGRSKPRANDERSM